MRAISERWRENLAKVFKLAGPFGERPHPHRFRHTFVRMLLEKGVPVADVAELIGDTEDIVRRHYAKWVPERQQRLSKILRDALDDKPKPKPLQMPGPCQQGSSEVWFNRRNTGLVHFNGGILLDVSLVGNAQVCDRACREIDIVADNAFARYDASGIRETSGRRASGYTPRTIPTGGSRKQTRPCRVNFSRCAHLIDGPVRTAARLNRLSRAPSISGLRPR